MISFPYDPNMTGQVFVDINRFRMSESMLILGMYVHYHIVGLRPTCATVGDKTTTLCLCLISTEYSIIILLSCTEYLV